VDAVERGMSGRTRAPLFLRTLDLDSLNRALAQIREELDEAQGLRGGHTSHDDLTVNGNVTINGSLTIGQQDPAA
jgi:hypothetical protein